MTKSDIADSNVADLSVTSTRVDEFEHLTSTFISPNRLVPFDRGEHIDGELRIHGTRQFNTFTLRHGRKIIGAIESDPFDDRVGFVMAQRGSGKLVLGPKEFIISERQGVLMTLNAPQSLHHAEDGDMRALVMNRHRISEHCGKLLGHDIEGDIAFEALFPLDDDAGQNWLRLVQYAATELSQPHSLARNNPAALQQLEQMVITGLLFGHSHNHSNALLLPQSAAAPHYVKRAEAFIEAHFADPITLADISVHAGISARSLQNGFQSFRGITPMAFLRSLRLQRAHRDLLAADPATMTVTQIAMNAGFNHMGEFSAMYKRTFGATPSQTLWRSLSSRP